MINEKESIPMNTECDIESDTFKPGERPFGVNLIMGKNFFIINSIYCNKTILIDLKTFKTIEKDFEDLEKDISYQYVLEDRSSGSLYHVIASNRDEFEIYKVNSKLEKKKLIMVCKYRPLSVFNNKIHFIMAFEGEIGHSYYPISGNKFDNHVEMEGVDVSPSNF